MSREIRQWSRGDARAKFESPERSPNPIAIDPGVLRERCRQGGSKGGLSPLAVRWLSAGGAWLARFGSFPRPPCWAQFPPLWAAPMMRHAIAGLASGARTGELQRYAWGPSILCLSPVLLR